MIRRGGIVSTLPIEMLHIRAMLAQVETLRGVQAILAAYLGIQRSLWETSLCARFLAYLSSQCISSLPGESCGCNCERRCGWECVDVCLWITDDNTSSLWHFLLGNIFDRTLQEVLASPKLQAINTEVQRGVMRCQQTCAYFNFCGGGSPANKLSEHGAFDVTETFYCQLKIQAIIDVMLEYVEQHDPGFGMQL